MAVGVAITAGWAIFLIVHRKHVALSCSDADMLDAWNTATGVVRFVKWLSTLVAAIAVITAAFKGFSGR